MLPAQTLVAVQHWTTLPRERENQRSTCLYKGKGLTSCHKHEHICMTQGVELSSLHPSLKASNLFHLLHLPLYPPFFGKRVFLFLPLVSAILLSSVSGKEGENSCNHNRIWSVVPLGTQCFQIPVDGQMKPQSNITFLHFSKEGNQ